MKNPRKNRARANTPGEVARPVETQRHLQRPWENRSFDAALTSLSHMR